MAKITDNVLKLGSSGNRIIQSNETSGKLEFSHDGGTSFHEANTGSFIGQVIVKNANVIWTNNSTTMGNLSTSDTPRYDIIGSALSGHSSNLPGFEFDDAPVGLYKIVTEFPAGRPSSTSDQSAYFRLYETANTSSLNEKGLISLAGSQHSTSMTGWIDVTTSADLSFVIQGRKQSSTDETAAIEVYTNDWLMFYVERFPNLPT